MKWIVIVTVRSTSFDYAKGHFENSTDYSKQDVSETEDVPNVVINLSGSKFYFGKDPDSGEMEIYS